MDTDGREEGYTGRNAVNRAAAGRDAAKAPYAVIVLMALNILYFFALEIFAGSTLETEVLIKGGGAYTPYVRDGQYWRMLTAMFMHAGMRHLLNNMLLLGIMGSALEGVLGKVRFAVVYLTGGLAGNIAGFLYYSGKGESVVLIGASGAVFAVIGAFFWIVIRNRGRVGTFTTGRLLVMLAFSLYFGFAEAGVANAAHLGGLAAGLLLGVLLYRKTSSGGAEGTRGTDGTEGTHITDRTEGTYRTEGSDGTDRPDDLHT